MPKLDETGILDKRQFSAKQIWCCVGFIALSVFSISSGYGALMHRADSMDAYVELQKVKDADQDNEIKKIDEKLDKEVYNAEQLSYRLTSANKKYIEKLEQNYQTMNTHMIEQRVKSDYMVKMLEELKGKSK